ncbi:MAG: DUF2934 domain-containing protein [Rhizobiaceae bacterium]|nr:DUF2934 domain-containing protein [Rhizobiaceae bacterium]
MDDIEQKQRERAYKIWEEEGRPDGRHLDHWQRADDQHEATEKVAEESADAHHPAPRKEQKTTSAAPPPLTNPD